ncbi:MAG: DNA cytosine methyltransferase [Colwellia sp.]|nr:DNA cytosine methyltransferase [Colwellia sp.]
MKVLNLYAGLGGNRKHWEGCEVTAIESNEKIAAVYQRLHPNDTVIICDAHEYLRANYAEFDFIWSSPPCQTHSKMAKATRHKNRKFPNMALYEEILFLKHFFKGKWIVENVVPFYEPLIEPSQKVGRHMFWSSFEFRAQDVKRPPNFINMANLAGKKALMSWLGIYYEENIYYEKNHCPAQILRNCVHPDLGLQIYKQIS